MQQNVTTSNFIWCKKSDKMMQKGADFDLFSDE